MSRFLRGLAVAVIASTAFGAVAIAQTVDRVEGEVRRINTAEGKVTLRHGPLPNLDMPAMTMVFTAKDPSILGAVKVGDKVDFVTQSDGGIFYVLEIKKK